MSVFYPFETLSASEPAAQNSISADDPCRFSGKDLRCVDGREAPLRRRVGLVIAWQNRSGFFSRHEIGRSRLARWQKYLIESVQQFGNSRFITVVNVFD
jgi:hypothetical protein